MRVDAIRDDDGESDARRALVDARTCARLRRALVDATRARAVASGRRATLDRCASIVRQSRCGGFSKASRRRDVCEETRRSVNRTRARSRTRTNFVKQQTKLRIVRGAEQRRHDVAVVRYLRGETASVQVLPIREVTFHGVARATREGGEVLAQGIDDERRDLALAGLAKVQTVAELRLVDFAV